MSNKNKGLRRTCNVNDFKKDIFYIQEEDDTKNININLLNKPNLYNSSESLSTESEKLSSYSPNGEANVLPRFNSVSFEKINDSQSFKETRSASIEYTEKGHKQINQYIILKQIGNGVHGKVKLAQNSETGEYVAIKIIRKSNKKKSNRKSLFNKNNFGNDSINSKISKEIAILKKIDHENIVKLIEVIHNSEKNKIYLVLEYCEGGEIPFRLTKEPNKELININIVRHIFRNILNGLQYLHKQGIIHRDIKPANLLFKENPKFDIFELKNDIKTKDIPIIKISDFGVSVSYDLFDKKSSDDLSTKNKSRRESETSSSECFSKKSSRSLASSEVLYELELAKTVGTPAFFAPELCWSGDNNKRPPITSMIDIWALGVTLYCLVFGTLPFNSESEYGLFEVIQSKKLDISPSNFRGKIANDLSDLLSKLFIKNPNERITLEQARCHPWVIEDLNKSERDIWLSPNNHIIVNPTKSEINEAVTKNKIVNFLKKLQNPFIKK